MKFRRVVFLVSRLLKTLRPTRQNITEQAVNIIVIYHRHDVSQCSNYHCKILISLQCIYWTNKRPCRFECTVLIRSKLASVADCMVTEPATQPNLFASKTVVYPMHLKMREGLKNGDSV